MDLSPPPGAGVNAPIRATLLALLLPMRLVAQGATHVLLVTGLSGDQHFADEYRTVARTLYDTARAQWHVADSSLIYLAETPSVDPTRVHGPATSANIAAAFATLARRVDTGDVVLVFVLGHGSGEGDHEVVNIPGPDATAHDYAGWVAELRPATVVFVNASSGSGDFLPVLAGPNRVVITATTGAFERNESLFGGYFVQGLTDSVADADKDGRISVLEAFDFATAAVARAYQSTQRLQTEHAELDDNGDGRGSRTPGRDPGGDGRLARRIAFGGIAAVADPRIRALLAEQRVLEARVDSLRAQKATMDSTAYRQQLEQLLLQIARKTEEIKALQGKQP
jgi:hypothetical protein